MSKALGMAVLVFACWSILGSSLLRAQAPPATPAPLDLEALAKQDVADMAAGRFSAVEAQYNTQMAFALPVGKLAQAWSGLLAHVGAFKGIAGVSTRSSSEMEVVTVACNFEQTPLNVVFVFDSGGRIGGLDFAAPETTFSWIAPPYADTSKFKEQPVTVTYSHWDLPGTLTMPVGAGPFPAVVLVQGSGPQDEDISLGPNKAFKDLAWGLASHGVAVLRYIKRTRQYGPASADDPTKMTVDDETINDARAAVKLLASQQGIDPHHIYLLGHSLGAYLAPRIATGDTQVAGLILLAGNTRAIEQLAVEMIRYLVAAQHVPPDEAQKDIANAEAGEKTIESPDLKPTDPVAFLGMQETGAFWLDLRGYDPVAVASHLTIPMLVLQGERDYQVTITDFDGWKKGLAGHANVTLKSYPALNHFFIAGTGPSTSEEYSTPGHVSSDVIDDISAWILTTSKAN